MTTAERRQLRRQLVDIEREQAKRRDRRLEIAEQALEKIAAIPPGGDNALTHWLSVLQMRSEAIRALRVTQSGRRPPVRSAS